MIIVAPSDSGLPTNQTYQTLTNKWILSELPMPTPRGEAGAVSLQGIIYVVGGSQPAFGNSVNANEAYCPQC